MLLHLCEKELEAVNKGITRPGEVSTGRYIPAVVGFDVETYAKLIEKDQYR